MLIAQDQPGPRGPRGRGTPPDPAQMVQMRVNMLANRLNLTDAQKTQAVTIYTDAVTASENLRSNLRTTHQSIRDAVKKNNSSEIESLSASVGTITGQLTAINAKADAAFYQILTADQKATYDSMPMGGPGGMGGMGGGAMGGGPMGGGRTWGGRQQ